MSAVAGLLAACGGPLPPMGAPDTMPRDQSVMTARAVSRHIGAASSTYRLLYSFGNNSDGQQPDASLIDVNGTLYGTTYQGGKYDGGTVFSISTTGKEHVLHNFGHAKDGQHPEASLIYVNGILYGTTFDGGKYNSGTFFSISMTGTEHVLHSFSNFDASGPEAVPINVKGTLYGTTAQGGRYTYGTVFSISTTGTVNVLHSFGHSTDGLFPVASLIDVNGTLYGTTRQGGKFRGKGTAFSISTSGAEHVLHSFGNNQDGAFPAASLIDVKGTLYGTTTNGGGGFNYGDGTVFSINTAGKEHVLHSFRHPGDGEDPAASLIDVNGVLYGTTFYGGRYATSFWGGTVFSITTSGAEHVLHSFATPYDGSNPAASLIDVKGTLYGTTSKGGAYGGGTVFTLKP
jgi:uncharacterized repeat protein (TIGR03803 family)